MYIQFFKHLTEKHLFYRFFLFYFTVKYKVIYADDKACTIHKLMLATDSQTIFSAIIQKAMEWTTVMLPSSLTYTNPPLPHSMTRPEWNGQIQSDLKLNATSGRHSAQAYQSTKNQNATKHISEKEIN